MAIAATTKWIYPPNWDDTEPQTGGYRKVIVQLTGVSTGTTNESAEKKVDISTLKGVNGKEVTRTVVERIEYANNGFGSIKLEWDRTPREVIAVLPANTNGVFDYEPSGGLVDKSDGTDGTGDILLTTIGASNGDSYNIVLTMRLKEDN
jgi:hypothetical protein